MLKNKLKYIESINNIDSKYNKKVIFQTWKNKNVPEHWKPSVDSIYNTLKGWNYVLLTDDDNENIVKTLFPEFYNIYMKYPYPIQRADAIRYCVLYKGKEIFGDDVDLIVYMDLDFTINRNLDDLFETQFSDLYLVPSGNIGSTITNSFMAARPGHSLFKECIDDMMTTNVENDWTAFGKHWKIMKSTGPMMLNRVVKKSKYPAITLPTKIFMPCNACNLNCFIEDDVYLKPLEGSSWHGFDSKVYNYCMCNWDILLIVLIILIILIILYFMFIKY